MRLPEIAILYTVIGASFAVARMAWRARPAGRAVDAALLALLWPLLGPFLLLRERGDAAQPVTGEAAFVAALRRAADTPLGALLPDEATARALGARLRVAAAKVVEIDGLLARPEFSESQAQAHIHGLRARGASECAIATAAMRLANIRRLRALRDRFATELDEVGELIAQLTTQAEVVRLAGSDAWASQSGVSGALGDTRDTGDLVRELLARVEGLDHILDPQPGEPGDAGVPDVSAVSAVPDAASDVLEPA